ncbi:uncharacterized protein LOC123501827 [Portunus trituberculatus]|uniref:uncharacterized protein LOC123501827 n=1 Tax=Portunus trituberculatus TaxID=210409 RepID=UPI001E1D1886|nr:uncharacterized protein LOC123501827 [Portunus trituberculatus]
MVQVALVVVVVVVVTRPSSGTINTAATRVFTKEGAPIEEGAWCWGRGDPLDLAPNQPLILCAMQCFTHTSCRLFTHDEGQCQGFTSSGLARCEDQGGGEGTEYRRLEMKRSLLKPVTASSSVTDHNVMFDVLTQAPYDWPSFSYCPCTVSAANEWVTVDLGQPYDLSLIQVTLSQEVGDEGNTNDPMVAQSPSVARTEREVVKYFVTARGRYVTLQQSEMSYFCMCNFEVFGTV